MGYGQVSKVRIQRTEWEICRGGILLPKSAVSSDRRRASRTVYTVRTRLQFRPKRLRRKSKISVAQIRVKGPLVPSRRVRYLNMYAWRSSADIGRAEMWLLMLSSSERSSLPAAA